MIEGNWGTKGRTKNKDGLNASDRHPQQSEENQDMNEAYYCLINGLKGHWNLGGEGEMGRREENNQGVSPGNVDNYRFYKSQKLQGT